MNVTKLEGSFDGSFESMGIGIVISRWNAFVTDQLYKGAVESLKKHGIKADQITAAYCPGSYEIPLTARQLLKKEDINGVIALGAVIRGETPHFNYICKAVTDGISELNSEFDKPVTFGVLTTDTVQQALERAGIKSGNKGGEAALALLEMLSLIKKIKNQ